MQDQDRRDTAQVDGDLERGQALRHLAQPGRTAHRHQRDGRRDEHAIGPAIGHAGDHLHLGEALVDLHHRDRAKQGEEGIGTAQHQADLRPAARCADGLEHIHRPAMDMAALVEDAIFEAQRDLRHLHRHREPADDEHPQDRARPAHGQRHRDAGDIAEANGAGQGGGERAPLADIALRLAFMRLAAQDADRPADLGDIGEAQPDGEEQHGERQIEHDQLDLRAEQRNLEEDRAGQRIDGGIEIFHAAAMPGQRWKVDQRLLWGR